ncbi:Single-stranded DNA-binding protein [Mesobacillus thioparans]
MPLQLFFQRKRLFSTFYSCLKKEYHQAITVKGDEKVINQVTLVGRLTRDPDLRYTPDGKAVSNITLAVNRHYKNASGEIEADFVHCILWGKTAENTSNYCKKGAVLGVTGRIQTRHYDNQEGKRVYVTEVVAEGVRFLSSKPATQSQQTSQPPQPVPPVPQREELPFV